LAEETTIDETSAIADAGDATAVAEAPAARATTSTATGPRENLYEGMFLLDSGKFASDPEGMAKKVTDLLEAAGGTVVLHRPWSDGKLAYPIGNHRKGLHYVTYFRMPTRGMTGLNRACKLSDFVIRHMVVRQPAVLFDQMVEALDPNRASDAADEEE
jgi:small subunit ribosomal protein S6